MRKERGVAVLFIAVFMISSALSLGVSPARTTLDFESGLAADFSFNVANSGEGDIKVMFSAQGNLSEYIFLGAHEGVVLASEKEKAFSYSLRLPESLEPGLHVGEVVIMQLPEEGSSEGSQLLATLAVVTQIHLYVPYPGKYANAKLYVYDADVGEDVSFVIPVVSAGEFDLTEVRANVDIYNEMAKKVDSFNVGPIAVPSGEQKELVYDWDMEVPAGEYLAKVTVSYGDGTISLEEKFNVGSEELELQEIRASDFRLGEIVKLEMLVENKWGAQIEDVLIKTKISNDKGRTVSEFQSSDYDVDASSKEVLVSYWDTAGVIEGDYGAEVSINHGEKESKKSLRFEVSENELVVIGLGYVISSDGGGDSSSVIVVLVVVIVVLVLINVLWFLVLRKRLGKK